MRMTASRVYMRPQPVPKMPTGIVELMEGLTREVLKNNPPDLYEFCANHMQKLLEIRDGPVSKRPLTLEEKIARAQQKVRERAEERKRRFDEEMKLRRPSIEKKNNEKPLENAVKDKDNQTTSNISETSLKGSVHHKQELTDCLISEPSLKAPVHHEQELTDALEVEIYHKPQNDLVPKEGENDHLKSIDGKAGNDTGLNESKVQETLNSDNEVVRIASVNSRDSEKHGKPENNISNADQNIENDKEEYHGNNSMDRHSEEKIIDATSDNSDMVKPEKIGRELSIVSTKSIESAPNKNDDSLRDKLVEDTGRELSIVSTKFIESASNENGKSLKEISQDNSNQLVEDTSANQYEAMIDDQEPKESELLNMISEVKPVTDQHKDFKQDPLINEVKEIKEELNTVKESEIVNTEVDKIINTNSEKGVNTITANILSGEKVQEEFISPTNDKDDQQSTKIKDLKGTSVLKHGDKSEVSDETIGSNVQTHTLKEADTTTDETEHKSLPVSSAGGSVEAIQIHNLKKLDELKDEKENESLPVGSGDDNVKDTNQDKKLDDEIKSELTKRNDGSIPEDKDVVLEDKTVDPEDNNTIAPEQNVLDDTLKQSASHFTVDVTNEDTDRDYLSTSETESEKPEIDQISKEPDHAHGRSKRHLDNISEGLEGASSNTDFGKSDSETVSIEKSTSAEDIAAEECNDNTESTATHGTTHSSTMDLETAAVTIQKVFRTFLFKSRTSTFEDSVNDDNNLTDEDTEKVDLDLLLPTPLNIKERRGITRMDTVLQTVNEEKSLSLSTDDSSLSSAATIIQAHVRGFLVRNRLSSNKTTSTSGPSTSLEADVDTNKINKTILNIIVPEGGHFMSRDESILTSMELSLDGSPPSSVNLHPLGYDKSEPRKQLKREDAIQSISPPSNNSGKLSEDVDSVKDVLDNEPSEQQNAIKSLVDDVKDDVGGSNDTTPTKSFTAETVVEAYKLNKETSDLNDDDIPKNDVRRGTLKTMSSDECDVVTPFEEKHLTDSDNTSGLLHSGEYHDIVLPTKISRSDTSVVREFKNVLAYFLIWNN